jgi:integrase
VHVKTGKAPRTPHIHGESVSKAVRRLRAVFDIEDVTLHDMRRSIATWLGEQGTLPDVIDRVLNHTPRDVTGRHYNHAPMLPMVRHAMQAWADHIEEIIGNGGDTITAGFYFGSKPQNA